MPHLCADPASLFTFTTTVSSLVFCLRCNYHKSIISELFMPPAVLVWVVLSQSIVRRGLCDRVLTRVDRNGTCYSCVVLSINQEILARSCILRNQIEFGVHRGVYRSTLSDERVTRWTTGKFLFDRVSNLELDCVC